jgi:sugar lactone lactonase YvrE
MKKNLHFLVALLMLAMTSGNAQNYVSVTTFSGTGVGGHVDNPSASAEFLHPYGICSDPATGDFYVADLNNNCIRKISNGIVSTFAGGGPQGDVDAQGINARFYVPGGLAFFNGDLYVSDNGNNKIKKIDAAGNVTTFAGTGAMGLQNGAAAQATFYNPTDLVVAPNGDIFVSDYYNHCIRKISSGQVTTYAGTGNPGDVLGPVATAQFHNPRSICMDGAGNLFIADLLNNKIKEVTVGGMVNLIAGSGVQGNVNGTGANASFYHPTGIDLDPQGNIIIVDAGNNEVRKITLAGVVTTVAGTGLAGFNNGPVATATFNDPEGMCVDANGVIYIGDKLNNVIRAISKGDVGIKTFSSSVQLSIFPNPTSDYLTIENSQNDYPSQIQILSADGKLVKSLQIKNFSAEIKIDVADLPNGIYFINAISAENKKYSGKFIKE